MSDQESIIKNLNINHRFNSVGFLNMSVDKIKTFLDDEKHLNLNQ